MSNKITLLAILVFFICSSWSLSEKPLDAKADRLVGRWNVTEESKEFRTQTYKVRIKADSIDKTLSDGGRCTAYRISNFGGFGNEIKTRVYASKNSLFLDSVQVFKNRLTVMAAKGKLADKYASISWTYTIKIKSKEYQFKATFVEDK